MRKTLIAVPTCVALCLAAGACSGDSTPAGGAPTPTTTTTRRADACSALALSLPNTRPIDTVVSATISASAGLRDAPPAATDEHAGPTLATLPPGTAVTVCGKAVRDDGKVVWKGIVLDNADDPAIVWKGDKRSAGWVLATKLRSR